MIELVNDIIKISKLDEKSISQEKEAVSLREVTTDIFKILSATAKNKNVHLNITGSSGMIFGVRSVIHEMIYNLIDNAIKYNKPSGSVDVNINSISKDTNKKESKVILTVKDTGIGIPHNEKERVFERFYRIEKSRSKELGGTGLGLSIVKHAAKYHNAIVTLDSDEGKGSTFTITFYGDSVL